MKKTTNINLIQLSIVCVLILAAFIVFKCSIASIKHVYNLKRTDNVATCFFDMLQ